MPRQGAVLSRDSSSEAEALQVRAWRALSTVNIARIEGEFYVDAAALRRAVRSRSSTNLVHRDSGIKVDLFVAGSELDARQLERRQRIQVTADPDRFLYVHSPEDILIQQLHWYRAAQGVSDRQWRDVLAIILVQGPRLDRDYLSSMAARAGLAICWTVQTDRPGPPRNRVHMRVIVPSP